MPTSPQVAKLLRQGIRRQGRADAGGAPDAPVGHRTGRAERVGLAMAETGRRVARGPAHLPGKRAGDQRGQPLRPGGPALA